VKEVGACDAKLHMGKKAQEKKVRVKGGCKVLKNKQ
jgi:hypothetical protein